MDPGEVRKRIALLFDLYEQRAAGSLTAANKLRQNGPYILLPDEEQGKWVCARTKPIWLALMLRLSMSPAEQETFISQNPKDRVLKKIFSSVKTHQDLEKIGRSMETRALQIKKAQQKEVAQGNADQAVQGTDGQAWLDTLLEEAGNQRQEAEAWNRRQEGKDEDGPHQAAVLDSQPTEQAEGSMSLAAKDEHNGAAHVLSDITNCATGSSQQEEGYSVGDQPQHGVNTSETQQDGPPQIAALHAHSVEHAEGSKSSAAERPITADMPTLAGTGAIKAEVNLPKVGLGGGTHNDAKENASPQRGPHGGLRPDKGKAAASSPQRSGRMPKGEARFAGRANSPLSAAKLLPTTGHQGAPVHALCAAIGGVMQETEQHHAGEVQEAEEMVQKLSAQLMEVKVTTDNKALERKGALRALQKKLVAAVRRADAAEAAAVTLEERRAKDRKDADVAAARLTATLAVANEDAGLAREQAQVVLREKSEAENRANAAEAEMRVLSSAFEGERQQCTELLEVVKQRADAAKLEVVRTTNRLKEMEEAHHVQESVEFLRGVLGDANNENGNLKRELQDVIERHASDLQQKAAALKESQDAMQDMEDKLQNAEKLRSERAQHHQELKQCMLVLTDLMGRFAQRMGEGLSEVLGIANDNRAALGRVESDVGRVLHRVTEHFASFNQGQCDLGALKTLVEELCQRQAAQIVTDSHLELAEMRADNARLQEEGTQLRARLDATEAALTKSQDENMGLREQSAYAKGVTSQDGSAVEMLQQQLHNMVAEAQQKGIDLAVSKAQNEHLQIQLKSVTEAKDAAVDQARNAETREAEFKLGQRHAEQRRQSSERRCHEAELHSRQALMHHSTLLGTQQAMLAANPTSHGASPSEIEQLQREVEQLKQETEQLKQQVTSKGENADKQSVRAADFAQHAADNNPPPSMKAAKPHARAKNCATP